MMLNHAPPRPVGWPSGTTLALLTLAALGGCGSATSQQHAAAPSDGPGTGDPLRRVTAKQLYDRGAVVAQLGDAVRAEQYLTAAIERGYPEERALPLLLQVCLKSHRLAAALHYGEPYLKLHPDDVHLRYLMSAVHLGMGHIDRASAELAQVLSRAPDHAAAHYLRGAIARDHAAAPAETAAHFHAYAKLAPEGVHADEVTAWLRQHDQQDGPVGTAPPAPAPAQEGQADAPDPASAPAPAPAAQADAPAVAPVAEETP